MFSPRITELVTKALALGIDLDRVLQYAFLLTIVERRSQVEVSSEDHTDRSRHELAGQIQGLETGYWDEQEAGTRYRRGRRARHRLGASLDGLIKKWRNFEQVARKHRVDLPVHNQRRLSAKSLEAVGKTLESLRTSLSLENDILKEQHPGRLSISVTTYTFWRFKVPNYRGKSDDMYRLAVAWRLSAAKDVETFRAMVRRVPRPSQNLSLLLGSAWQLLCGNP
jgi:hypothetical protein